jgi:hypothetical protein
MLTVCPWSRFRPPTGPISPGAEHAGGRHRATERLLQRRDVAVGLPEQLPAAAVACEHERRLRRTVERLGRQQQLQILGRRRRVAHVQPDAFASLHDVADDERAAIAVGAEQVADQVVTRAARARAHGRPR